GRTGSDYTERYPELAMLGRLPAGTVLDGELVALRGGRADFPALLQRHQRHAGGPLGPSMQRLPIRYLVFDLLCHGGRSLLKEPLHERRARLRELLTEIHEPLLTFSDGIVGQGRDFYTRVLAQGHEGVMAKQLTSRYQPGKRSPVWKKIKPVQVLPCVIVGYRPGRERVRSLLLATVRAGILRYVGQVHRGLSSRLFSIDPRGGFVPILLAPAWLMAISAVGQPVACHRRAQAPAEPLPLRLFWAWFPRYLI